MCELLGMSANVPTDMVFSLTGLMSRGGETGPHRDGWGVAFYEGKGVRVFRDPAPGSHSEVARFLQRYPIKSCVVVSHVRQANRGRICLENTHPFVRELWGSHWVFAHNGQLKGIKSLPLSHYRPVGTTDSEHAFCWLLGEIRSRHPRRPARRQTLWRLIEKLVARLHQHGVFNCLLSDSTVLYSYCSSKLCWLTRRAPFGEARLADTDVAVDFSTVTTPSDIVTVIATQPLTVGEQWQYLQSGEFEVFDRGLPVWSRRGATVVEQHGN